MRAMVRPGARGNSSWSSRVLTPAIWVNLRMLGDAWVVAKSARAASMTAQ